MRELTLGGLHENSDYLVLLDAEGERYTVKIDEALRAAVRRDIVSLGLIQSTSRNTFRPKDIQAMLRSGSSVESIAELAGIPVERVQRYEGPVLAERAHMAERAQGFRTSQGSEDALGETVDARLLARGVEGDPQWDAWRRADGSWTLQLTFSSASRERTATWKVDVPNRIVSAEDDEARWLSDSEDPVTASRPRVAAVRGDVFDVAAHSESTPEVSAANGTPATQSTPISHEQLEALNAQRGIPQTTNPWKALGDNSLMSTPAPRVPSSTPPAEAPRDLEEKVAPVRIVPINAHHHQSGDNIDALETEEVNYIDGPEDLHRSIDQAHEDAAVADHDAIGQHDAEHLPDEERDPAKDPSASADFDADSEFDSDADADAQESGNESEGADAAQPDPSPQLKLTPLPGFDDEPATEKIEKKPASKKGRASIPSWDDIVFGKKDR